MKILIIKKEKLIKNKYYSIFNFKKMKLPNTIISLIFNEIKENEWITLFFLFMDEIEWKINHLKKINSAKVIGKFMVRRENEEIFTICNKNNNLDWNVLKTACYYDNFKIIIFMIKKMGIDPNIGLGEGCGRGNLKIINLMIKYGADNWNHGLCGACEGGHLKIVKLMIEKGADYWNLGLGEACLNYRHEIVRYMIKMGATKCRCGKPINNRH